MAGDNLNFHQTFPPSADALSRLLADCPMEKPLTKEEISACTGIPTGKSSGKVEPHIAYAEYMGLLKDKRTEGKHFLTLTPLGKTILTQNPGFQETVTLLVCHFRLTSISGGAPLWSGMFRRILSRYPSGVSDALLRDELEREFHTVPKTGALYSSYSGMFQPLDVLERGGGMTVLHAHSFQPECIYACAYGFFREWESAYPGQREMTARDISALNPFSVLGWNQGQSYTVMERMEEMQIMQFNRQLTPYIVTKLCDSDALVSRLYDALC